ncbi:GNAT family N-acetyltransferase [Botryobacter ruber]|uniref:GNAT family N-acetyltransferase n=1 Tax=Botryobacter ruber TaxID=2171629 RepID=UPI001F0BBEA9|nr:GNAT family N-acetyltransferase [Botryobacter ruber]
MRVKDEQVIEVVRYETRHKTAWDAFVAGSKNGTFLLYRDYLEYHADRFQDHSLLFYRKGRLLALLPANQQGEAIYSHGGVTYGGIVSDSTMKVALMLEVFEALCRYFALQGAKKLFYKAIPHIYHRLPAEEDLYALFRFNARLYRRDIGSTIELQQAPGYARTRKWQIAKASGMNLQLGQSGDYENFMKVQQQLLQEKYGSCPVHTAAELRQLAQRFPKNIKLFTATEAGVIQAGIIIYETTEVAHCQYIATTARGRAIYALDALVHYLLHTVYPHKKYFDFGKSTEQEGRELNEGLIWNKESFGGRGIVQDFYELQL